MLYYSMSHTLDSNIRGILRAYPTMFVLIALVLGLVCKVYMLSYLSVVVVMGSIFNNKLLKNILFKILDLTHLQSIALRPDGAKNCSPFINEFIPNKPSDTYGMPSGHSVEAMIITIFLITYILDKHEKGWKRNGLILLVILIGISICVSRITLGCHTIPQVIVGSCIGGIIGFFSYKLWNNIDKYLFDVDPYS